MHSFHIIGTLASICHYVLTLIISAHQHFLCFVISFPATISMPYSVCVRWWYGFLGGGQGPSLGNRPRVVGGQGEDTAPCPSCPVVARPLVRATPAVTHRPTCDWRHCWSPLPLSPHLRSPADFRFLPWAQDPGHPTHLPYGVWIRARGYWGESGGSRPCRSMAKQRLLDNAGQSVVAHLALHL